MNNHKIPKKYSSQISKLCNHISCKDKPTSFFCHFASISHLIPSFVGIGLGIIMGILIGLHIWVTIAICSILAAIPYGWKVISFYQNWLVDSSNLIIKIIFNIIIRILLSYFIGIIFFYINGSFQFILKCESKSDEDQLDDKSLEFALLKNGIGLGFFYIFILILIGVLANILFKSIQIHLFFNICINLILIDIMFFIGTVFTYIIIKLSIKNNKSLNKENKYDC